MKTTSRIGVITTFVATAMLAATEADAGYLVRLTDCRTGRAINGATVKALTAESVPGRPSEVRTGADGSSLIYPYPGDRPHRLTLSAPGYQMKSKDVFISSQNVLQETVCLDPVAAGAPPSSTPPSSSGGSRPPGSSATAGSSQTAGSPQTTPPSASGSPATSSPQTADAPPVAESAQAGASTDWAQQERRDRHGSHKTDGWQAWRSTAARSAQDRAASLGSGAADPPAVPFAIDGMPPNALDDAVARLGRGIAHQQQQLAVAGPRVPTATTTGAGADVTARLDTIDAMLDEVAQVLAKLEAKLDRDTYGSVR